MTFRAATQEDRALIHEWLALPHVSEWFYGQGLENTITHLDQFIKTGAGWNYWVACDDENPFAMFITTDITKPNDEVARWCEGNGKAITLDLLIGDTAYMGKGLSHTLIQEFLLSQFPDVREVLIDPSVTNTRAIHVYQKAGFKILEERNAAHDAETVLMMRLNMDELKRSRQKLDSLEIFVPKLDKKTSLPLVSSSVAGGFPSPAEDYIEKRLDLNELLIQHPVATFYVRVEGDSMEGAGIFSGDVLIVDRSLTASSGKIIIAVLNGEFTVKRLVQKGEELFLQPENSRYKPIQVNKEDEFQVWGVVTYVIHKTR